MHHRWKWGFAFAAVLLALAGSLPASAGVPDVNMSFFVPQAGSLTTPCEGVNTLGSPGTCSGVPANGNLPAYAAISVFPGGALGCTYTCPNVDGGAVLRNWARLKVVVRASDGSPIANIPAADICAMFNGGTVAQGFSGVGADAIAADPQWSGGAAIGCPAVRCVQADAPTDATGTTYITWIGHRASDAAGMGNRDPNRKWGGYDSEIPVLVLGYKLRGQLATTGPGAVAGNYICIVKNFDVQGSNLAIANSAEKVSNPTDYNYVNARLGAAPGAPTAANPSGPPAAFGFDVDYTGNGTVTNPADFNLFTAHLVGTHTCNFPCPAGTVCP